MKKILNFLLVAFLIFAAGACLEDQGFTDIQKSKNFIPVVSLLGTENGRYSVAVQISSSEDVTLTVATPSTSSDLVITFKNDGQAAVDAYNIELTKEAIARGDSLPDGTVDPAKFKPFILLPESVYTIPSLSVTAPKGTRSTNFVVKVNSAAMSLTEKYVLPLTIASVSGDPNAVISANQKSILAYVQLKNKYDGLYKVTGTLTDVVVPAITGFYPWKVALVTNGANQVLLYDNDAGFALRHLILNGTALTSYGNVGVAFDFDPATNKVTNASNFLVDPAPRSRTIVLDPTGVNTWDPATKTLQVKYFLYQGGTLKRTSFDETYKFTGDR
jgi:hypothetical protein